MRDQPRGRVGEPGDGQHVVGEPDGERLRGADALAAESMPDGFYALQEEAFVGLERLDRLVVAQIHGYCLGGGLQLALACDIRILAEDAVLGLPAAAEGLPPGMATWRLPRYVGLGRAMRLSVGGERVGAGEALAIGLADHVLPVAGFADAAAGLVAHYLAVPQGAARATKELVRSAFDTDFATAHARSRALVAECLAGPDVAAARAAWAAQSAPAERHPRPTPLDESAARP